jgi:hypothetical protein
MFNAMEQTVCFRRSGCMTVPGGTVLILASAVALPACAQ